LHSIIQHQNKYEQLWLMKLIIIEQHVQLG